MAAKEGCDPNARIAINSKVRSLILVLAGGSRFRTVLDFSSLRVASLELRRGSLLTHERRGCDKNPRKLGFAALRHGASGLPSCCPLVTMAAEFGELNSHCAGSLDESEHPSVNYGFGSVAECGV